MTWERTEREDGPSFFNDPRLQRQEILPAEVHPPRTELLARPFAAFGFKAYMTPRSFFRSDLKLVVRNGVDEALLRFGFGMDF